MKLLLSPSVGKRGSILFLLGQGPGAKGKLACRPASGMNHVYEVSKRDGQFKGKEKKKGKETK